MTKQKKSWLHQRPTSSTGRPGMSREWGSLMLNWELFLQMPILKPSIFSLLFDDLYVDSRSCSNNLWFYALHPDITGWFSHAGLPSTLMWTFARTITHLWDEPVILLRADMPLVCIWSSVRMRMRSLMLLTWVLEIQKFRISLPRVVYHPLWAFLTVLGWEAGTCLPVSL